ncbi:MAG: UbiA family prenyltransferase [Dehalococcoidia bacterium]|nr:UbiA family prenyltransferase [Dehalococcoidia bacterium]
MRMSTLVALVQATRPRQWPKNGLVFAAFVFSLGDAWMLDDADTWWPLFWRSCALFAAWCAASSATYLVNDVKDAEVDRVHPRKRYRPIASGRLPIPVALVAAGVLAAAGIAGAVLLDPGPGSVIVGRGVHGRARYGCGGLKQVAIIDIFILGAGVVGRAVSGGLAIEVEISPWLYVCSMFGALFFATSKRWAEFRQLGEEAGRGCAGPRSRRTAWRC